MRRVLAVVALTLAGTLGAHALPAADPPLLATAQAQHYLYPLGTLQRQEELLAEMAMLSLLSRKFDADGRCTSDACVKDRRDIYAETALAYSRLGMKLLALRFFRAVESDAPNDAEAHYDVAAELDSLHQTEGAEKEFGRALELSSGKDQKIEEGAARFYLLNNRLDLARAHFEHCILLQGEADLSQYCAIGLALTRMHGGNDSLLLPITTATTWPGPLLTFVRGKGDEAALAAEIARTENADTRRQHLCEALYYVGEWQLQRGEAMLALRYFRASVSMRVESFWETRAAMLRIEQLHGNDDVLPTAPPPSHAPIG